MQCHDSIDLNALEDEALRQLLLELSIVLTVAEARSIQRDMLLRAPTLAELVLFSIQGSEHSSYKSSRIHLKKFKTQSERVVIGAEQDAGVIRLLKDENQDWWCLIVSHESHNHPSQIVPFEGAATGVGGNVRDVLCMGGEVIASADALRFGDYQRAQTKWIRDGVVAGIGGYGNPIGVPTIAGDVFFDKGYDQNCLVTLVSLGIVKEQCIIPSKAPPHAAGFDLILVGKPTDASGFGGASFSSIDIDQEKHEQNLGAVQEPNAFLKQHLMQSTLSLFAKIEAMNRIGDVGFKDLGAGGIACASVELADAANLGAEIDLEKVPLAHLNLTPTVILCSETQERFMWVCPCDLTQIILTHYNDQWELPSIAYNARASVIGRIFDHNRFIVRHHNHNLVDAPTEQVTRGFLYDEPWTLSSSWPKASLPTSTANETPEDLGQKLTDLLMDVNCCSRKPIFDQYDKQVQGRTILEPGFADAGVIAPFNGTDYPSLIRDAGIAIATDQNPRYCKADPYWGSVRAVLEAVSNVVCTGAKPIALSDCLCAGNPKVAEQMGEFVAMVHGICDACDQIEKQWMQLPIIAGNVSLNNVTHAKPIIASPMVACVGILNQAAKALGMGLIKPEHTLILVGDFRSDLRCSLFAHKNNLPLDAMPNVSISSWIDCMKLVAELIDDQLVASCHDVSSGGRAVAVAKMAMCGGFGVELDYPNSSNQWWFSEAPGFILEVDAKAADLICQRAQSAGIECAKIGTIVDSFCLKGTINLNLSLILDDWQNALYRD